MKKLSLVLLFLLGTVPAYADPTDDEVNQACRTDTANLVALTYKLKNHEVPKDKVLNFVDQVADKHEFSEARREAAKVIVEVVYADQQDGSKEVKEYHGACVEDIYNKLEKEPETQI